MPLHGKAALFKLKLGGGSTYTTIKNTNEWSINGTAQVSDLPIHGKDWLDRIQGMKEWAGTLGAFAQNLATGTAPSAADNIMQAFVSMPTIKARFCLTAATLPRYEGTIIPAGFGHTAPAGAEQSQSLDFSGTGELTLVT